MKAVTFQSANFVNSAIVRRLMSSARSHFKFVSEYARWKGGGEVRQTFDIIKRRTNSSAKFSSVNKAEQGKYHRFLTSSPKQHILWGATVLHHPPPFIH